MARLRKYSGIRSKHKNLIFDKNMAEQEERQSSNIDDQVFIWQNRLTSLPHGTHGKSVTGSLNTQT